jgi:O-antigen ligase
MRPGFLDRIGFGALLLALALAPIIGGFPPGAAYGADLSLGALRALALAAALCRFASGTLKAPRSLGLGAIWTLFGLNAISLLANSRLLTSPVLLFAMLPATLDALCAALVFALAADAAARSPRRLMAVAGALFAAVAWSAISGAREYGMYVQSGAAGQRVFGPFFDPNFLAGFLALGLPLVLAATLAVRERLAALGLGVLAALACGALAATGSRSGIGIALLGAALTFALALLRVRKGFPPARLIALVIGCAALMAAFRGPLTARVGSGGAAQEHSAQFRKFTWRGTVAMAAAHPVLGAGPGTFPDRYPPYAIVEKTGLAHSSYLQTAAETGGPSLVAAALAIAAALFALLRRLQTAGDDTAPATRLMLCGIAGALVAGAARSVFDSEWSILGNALPFWAVAGLASSGWRDDSRTDVRAVPAMPRIAGGCALAAALGLSIFLLRGPMARDAARAQLASGQQPVEASVWPPDPDLLSYTGHPDAAAIVEPSGARFYKLARAQERAGDLPGAISSFHEAARLDPNGLQIWRALAEAQERAGNTAGALHSWTELIRRYEGPAGQIRAIPELAETHPAFAYAALARARARAGNRNGARDGNEKAAAIVEAYSLTPELYQRMEAITAQTGGADLAGRRAEIRALYVSVINALTDESGPSAEARGALVVRRDATLARLDRMVALPTSP